MIRRELEDVMAGAFGRGKAVIIIGARQVGKTTLLHAALGGMEGVQWLNGDDTDVRVMFENASSTSLRALLGGKRVVVIDEAQRISNIGLVLKLIIDNNPGLQVVATGSSSFELSNSINEPLTGRKLEYAMYPLSFSEMVSHTSLLEEKRMLRHRMVYGYYPDVVTDVSNARETLHNLADSYLYKDILTLDKVKKNDKLVKLVQALAFQVGSQVSYNELSQTTGLDGKTVDRYITLLEQSYIVFRLGSFSRNLRNELRHTRKVFFYDLGVRNAVLGDYSPIEVRNPSEVGALWENYVMAERMKYNAYRKRYCHTWFWRDKAKHEIDCIEELDGTLTAFEFKWNARSNAKMPRAFSGAYPEAVFRVVTPDNYHEFLM